MHFSGSTQHLQQNKECPLTLVQLVGVGTASYYTTGCCLAHLGLTWLSPSGPAAVDMVTNSHN